MAISRPRGLEALRARVPELQNRWGIARVVLAFIVAIALTTLFFIVVDRVFPEWMPDGEILVLALGFWILSGFFSQRRRYQRQFAAAAYRHAFAHFIIPGLGIVAGSVAHLAYMPGPPLPDLWWKQVVVALGWFSLAVGIVLWWRSVAAFGTDNFSLLYVYFPEDGRMVNTGIFGLLRHPIYAAALRIGAGLALIHANWYALVVAPVLLIFFTGWIALVEEKELLSRFPEYRDYRRSVPAFGPRFRDVPAYLRLLVLGG